MAYDATAGMLKAQVRDTGKGISPKDMPQLFKMFGKLKRTSKENDEGIGLGLLISQNLIRMNQGEISVHSDGLQKGCAFNFSMRMQTLEQAENQLIVGQEDL